MSSSQSNKLGQIYVEWDIKTEILRYVSACSVARNSNCPNSTLCIGGEGMSVDGRAVNASSCDLADIGILLPPLGILPDIGAVLSHLGDTCIFQTHWKLAFLHIAGDVPALR